MRKFFENTMNMQVDRDFKIFCTSVFVAVIGLAVLGYMGLQNTYDRSVEAPTSKQTVVTTHAEHKFLLNHSLTNLYTKGVVDSDVHYLADTACNEVYVKACSQSDRLLGADYEGKIK